MRKIIPYILILIALVGILGATKEAHAEDRNYDCVALVSSNSFFGTTKNIKTTTENICKSKTEVAKLLNISAFDIKETYWIPSSSPTGLCTVRDGEGKKVFEYAVPTELCQRAVIEALAVTPFPSASTFLWKSKDVPLPGENQSSDSDKSEFEKMVAGKACISLNQFDMGGCVLKFLFYAIYMPVAGILWLAAQFFDYLIYITLSGTLFDRPFVAEAWGVVRDLSNIFFILILLYAAIATILDLGHGEGKKIIAKVVVIALLINFSMFFTKIVIDTSNVLALIFYNKLDVTYVKPDGTKGEVPGSIAGEKGVSGSMANSFNLTKLMTADTFKAAGEQSIPGTPQSKTAEPSSGLMITILLVAIGIMGFAAYAFTIAGLSFLGRLIELLILIVFSPFAFMSSTVSKFSHAEYIGWDNWIERLIKISFMAPIFMFFMYFIFLLMKNGITKELITPKGDPKLLELLLMVTIPALLILSLLLRATKFAKEGAGQFGEMATNVAKVVGGLALGAATGGVALAGTGVLGSAASKAASSEKLKESALNDKGLKGFSARMALKTANYGSKASFDIRQTELGKFAEKKSGMNLDKGLGVLGLDTHSFKGGRAEQIEHKAEEEVKNKKMYQMSGAAAKKQDDRQKEYLAEFNKINDAGGFIDNKDRTRFKKAYEEGDASQLSGYGIHKKIEAGRVDTSKEINHERDVAYADSLDAKGKKEAEHAVQTFFKEWAKGAGKMVASPVGAGTTLAAGALTGGVGAVVTIAGGGFLYALKQTLSVSTGNPEVVAEVRHGEDKGKKLLKDIKKFIDADKEHGDGHAKPAVAAVTSSTAPGSATAADHHETH